MIRATNANAIIASGLQLLLLSGAYSSSPFARANVVISEIAYKGTNNSNNNNNNICGERDWIELYNNNNNNEEEAAVFDLSGYILHDNKGFGDEDAHTFAEGTSIGAGEYLLLCRDTDFSFGIGADDTVTLVGPTGIETSSVELPGTGGGDGTETYALIGSKYEYTSSPTPGDANVFTEPVSREEKLRVQNEAGEVFFRAHQDDETFGRVVDVYVTVPEDSLAIIEDHPGWEEWVPFDAFSVSNADEEAADAIAASIGGGRIRVKGQSTNTMTACMGLRNVPFNVEFDTPFLGMENVYLRNHLSDFSYMREHASHTMLKAFGLPYARTRPVRLFLNGSYTGFYTLMEAPTQGYVMQRSFGPFDPDTTAIFKAKTAMTDCPFAEGQAQMMINMGGNNMEEQAETPEDYYFDRGDHRRDTPVLRDTQQCLGYFIQEISREQTDVYRGFLENDQQCGKAMVELGRMDRDFGPKSMEEPMISFLDDKFFNEDVDDITDAIDADQWLRNFATYSIMLNLDSPISNTPNNWYIAGTQGGYNGDWKIVQYDHNNIATRDLGTLCEASCGPRLVYWPILRPTCGAVESSKTVGRILNSDENVQKYLEYIAEYLEILESEKIVDKLYEYGNDIKEYITADPFFSAGNMLDLVGTGSLGYQSAEDYEASELGRDVSDFNSGISPFLKTLTVRLEQVKEQLEAIEDGTLPRNGEYDPAAVCPDWRDTQTEDYLPGSTVAEDCALDFCKDAGACYDNSPFTCIGGTLLIEECKALSPMCDSCFPYSQCGSGGIEIASGALVESADCPSETAQACAPAAACFDHRSGQCSYDGTILTVECRAAMECKACFPNSRCARDDFVPPEIPMTPNGNNVTETDSNPQPSSSSATTTTFSTSTAAVVSWMLLALTMISAGL